MEDELVIVHCNMRFMPDEIQFLEDNEMFTDRKLEIATCPVCQNMVVRFVEKRITDSKIFDDVFKKKKAKRLLKELENQVTYSTLEFGKPSKKVLFGFRYGENKEHVNKKTGEVTITQKSCDFYGNKEVTKILNGQ